MCLKNLFEKLILIKTASEKARQLVTACLKQSPKKVSKNVSITGRPLVDH